MKNITTLIIVSLMIVPSYGQETPPEGGEPKDFTLPNKNTTTLENGLKAVTVQYGAVPKVTVNLIIRTGNVHEGEQEVWLADLTGDLMKEGTATRDAKSIAEEVAGMGGELNISVSGNQTTISGSVLSEFTPDLINLIGDIVQNPLFPESEIDRLKNDLKRQLSVQKTRPQPIAREEFFGMIYPDHPYGRVFPTEEMIDGYTVDQVREFYDNNFGAQRSNLYIVGKFNEAEALEAVNSSFNQWKEGPAKDYPLAEPQTQYKITIIDRPEAPQSTIIMGLPVIDPTHEDYVPLLVTNALLGGSFGSRITSNIREDKGYTYSPFSTIDTEYRVATWYEQADVTTEHTGASLREITKEINRLQNEAPSEEELKGIQNYRAGIFVLQNSSRGGIINQLNFLDFHGLDDSYLTNMVKNIHAITPEKVQEIAQKYIRDEEMTIVIVGDENVIKDQISEYEAGVGEL